MSSPTISTGGVPTTAAFDYHDEEFQADPWRVYRALLAGGPVHFSTAVNCYLVVGAEAVREGLSQEDVVADFPLRTSRRTFGRNLLDVDGAAHRAFRGYIAPLLSARYVRSYTFSAIRPLVHEVVEELPSGVSTPVVPRLAALIPYRLMCRLLGLPPNDADWLYQQMRPIARTLDYPPDTSSEVNRAKRTVEGYFEDILARGAIPDDTMTARILHAMRDGPERFAEAEVLATLLLVLLAGTETSIAAITNVVHALAVHDDAFDRCRTPEGAVAVIREALRLRPPVHSVLRFAGRDLELAGVAVRRRQPILFSLAAANRDPSVFPDPDTFDPDRQQRGAVTFATGPHACPGMNFAEAELAEICLSLAGRFTSVTVDPGTDRDRGHSFRHPGDLSLVFT
ncbi:cytochrome P450 [Micromonospora lupini]|uniref:cytochrome P450 n=1 Tax=Micromonospora lupini TaxID=285679 RepID=UPI0033FD8AAE